MKAKGFAGAIAICALSLCAMFHGLAAAEDTPILQINIQADKPQYSKNETAKLTITVENTSDWIACDVNIANMLPNGLVYAPQQKQTAFSHAEIPPRSSVQHEIYVKVVDSSGLPQTGDGWPYMPFVLLAAVSGLIGITALSRERRASV